MAKDERWRANDGVYFGFSTDRGEGPEPQPDAKRLFRYVGDRHLITIGPNGSGKSRRLLVPNLAELTKWSVLVVDPKGELAVMTRARREAAHNKVVILNPFGANGIESDGYNPLTALRPNDPNDEDFVDDAMGLAESLIRVEGKEPHFSQSAQELVCALIMYAKLVLADPSLADVRKMLSQKGTALRDMVTDKTVKYGERRISGMLQAAEDFDCPELAAKAARFADIGPENRELSSIISTAITQTRWLDSPPIKRDVAKGDFDFGKMKEEAWAVYLILPARRLVTHSTWLRLMITSVMQALMKGTEKASTPVLLMLDEFAQLGFLPAIEQNIGIMRSYGIKVWAVLQDLSQAKHLYGDRWESFISNAGVVQSFAPQDLFTAQTISALGDGAIGSKELRRMRDGFGVVRSHKVSGITYHFAPYPDPDTMPELKDVCALDPTA